MLAVFQRGVGPASAVSGLTASKKRASWVRPFSRGGGGDAPKPRASPSERWARAGAGRCPGVMRVATPPAPEKKGYAGADRRKSPGVGRSEGPFSYEAWRSPRLTPSLGISREGMKRTNPRAERAEAKELGHEEGLR